MEIINALNKRYSAKAFDKNKKISKENIDKIESILQLSPSSTNIQPWHFILAQSDEAKKKISKGAQGFFSFNEQKILDASAVIIFSSKTDLDENYLSHLTEKEDLDNRYKNDEARNMSHNGRKTFVDFHKNKFNDLQSWNDKQLYLNLGNFLVSIATLEIDSVPMEGLSMNIIDEEFNLRDRGFSAKVVVALGYHSDNDYNLKLPKSRLEKDEIIERL
jgi:nitroreductase/dihydropteridine reductase